MIYNLGKISHKRHCGHIFKSPRTAITDHQGGRMSYHYLSSLCCTAFPDSTCVSTSSWSLSIEHIWKHLVCSVPARSPEHTVPQWLHRTVLAPDPVCCRPCTHRGTLTPFTHWPTSLRLPVPRVLLLLVQQLWTSGGLGNLANFLPSQGLHPHPLQWDLNHSLGEGAGAPFPVCPSLGTLLSSAFFTSLWLLSYLSLIIPYFKLAVTERLSGLFPGSVQTGAVVDCILNSYSHVLLSHHKPLTLSV